MNLKPQDVLVVLKLLVAPERRSYGELAAELGMSASEVHAATKRATRAQLLVELDGGLVTMRRNLREFLVHGIRYVFVPELGAACRGVVTGFEALQERHRIGLVPREAPRVWPHPEGSARGESVQPLYRSVPEAALRDRQLHAALAIVDELRLGRTRERKEAARLLDALMEVAGDPGCAIGDARP